MNQFVDVDLFAGGGGMSEAMRSVHGKSPEFAINHDPIAIQTHEQNHPECMHFCCGIQEVDPVKVLSGKKIRHLHASPDCTHFSKANGNRPVNRSRRALANHIIRWAKAGQPDVITMENVEEFLTWGPLIKHGKDKGKPDPARAGQDFWRWHNRLTALGYAIDYQVLRACDYGAPTTRKRLFIVMRKDGQPIKWPKPTHGTKQQPYRTTAECIDWSLPGKSIFNRAKPLAEKTMQRIAQGVVKYVLNDPQPFLITLDHYSNKKAAYPVNEPLNTITTKNRHALITPFITKFNNHAPGQSVNEPLQTIMAGGMHFGLVTSFLTKYYGGVVGTRLDQPIGTITTIDHHGLVACKLQRDASDHAELIAPFLIQYYGSISGQHSSVSDPLPTIVTRARHGLVNVFINGESFVITDIHLRMLQPHELAAAQGFPSDYQLPKAKAKAIRLIGNSVPPDLGAAVVRSQFESVSMKDSA